MSTKPIRFCWKCGRPVYQGSDYPHCQKCALSAEYCDCDPLTTSQPAFCRTCGRKCAPWKRYDNDPECPGCNQHPDACRCLPLEVK